MDTIIVIVIIHQTAFSVLDPFFSMDILNILNIINLSN